MGIMNKERSEVIATIFILTFRDILKYVLKEVQT